MCAPQVDFLSSAMRDKFGQLGSQTLAFDEVRAVRPADLVRMRT